VPDPDGRRTERQCTKCGAHSGDEFIGEHLTVKNTRDYVNSLSKRLIPTTPMNNNEMGIAMLATGCF